MRESLKDKKMAKETDKLAEDRTEIIEQCEGCKRIHLCGRHCRSYLFPMVKWEKGRKCPLASHIETEKETAKVKKRIGQQKAQRQTKLSKKQQVSYSRIGDRK